MIQPAADLHAAFLLVAARANFRSGGWDYRTAAAQLGCSFPHLFNVLSGQRQSTALLTRILSLPAR